jgi:hypothetical protein
MIHVYIHSPTGATSVDVHTASDAYAALQRAPQDAGAAVLRIDTDAEWLDLDAVIAEKIQRAAHGSALISAPAFAWIQAQSHVDGAGWRIVCAKRQLQAQVQPVVPPPAMFGPNGLSGRR